ncbi:MAG: DUF3800 domain-containing protein [Bacteroidales bacterium]|nr:DUF3800 domain-containing protein [Bacteroidales bacterium]
MEFNIYCDESCHLKSDYSNIMVLGAIWCLQEKKRRIFKRLREIKVHYNLPKDFEIKWHKVSPAKVDFYLSLIDYFFDTDDLHFRALVVPDKSGLDHNSFNQTHDDFYYKMYFDLLKVILNPTDSYNIFLDIKDSKSQEKVNRLTEILRNNHYDYNKTIIKNIQQVKSHEVELIPLTDLLIGAVCYQHRGLKSNSAKLKIIERIQERSGYSLMNSTLFREEKTNIFIWKSRKS